MKKHIADRKTFIATVVILFIFWLSITWKLHWQHLVAGAFCVAAVAVFNRELMLSQSERPLVLPSTVIKWITYILLLVWEVAKSNLAVAKIVLSPKMNISPCFVRFRPTVKKPLNKVILGNSITLTPGTLTVDIEEDYFVVHAITHENAEGVATWDMMERLAVMEEAEERA